MFALQLTGLAICFLGGMVVHRWLARRWFDALGSIDEQELLMHGLLASVIINGTVGTYLAMLHLFYPAAFAIVLAGCMLWLREDTKATFQAARAAVTNLARQVRSLRPLPILALCGCLFLGAALLAMCRIPTSNIDAWAFHLPLAFSITEQHGFIYPQIGHLFYSHQPLFINVLFAQALAIEPHFLAASAVNVLIYLFTLVSLAAIWRQRALALVLLLLLIGGNTFFTLDAASPLTDLPRSCLSVLGLTCATLYLSRRIPYYAGLAALCVGAAIASKFTELISLAVLGTLLLPELRLRSGRILMLKCVAVVAVIAAYWYLKNLILLGNPLYPFLFGHPGLSDAWIADYMAEMTRAFDPAQRDLQHSLLSADGWRDFLGLSWTSSLANRGAAMACLGLGVVGAVLAPRKIASLLAINLFLFVFWYTVMFNHIRWVTPAYMMLYVMGIHAFLTLLDRFAATRELQAWMGTLFGPARVNAAVLALASTGMAMVFALPPLAGLKHSVLVRLEPIIGPMSISLRPGGMDLYLATARDGYTLYRYVAQHELRRVFQPYDSGVKLYASAYNGGQAGEWFVDIHQVPSELEHTRQFILDQQIAYYITRPDLKAVEAERLGKARLEVASRVIDALRPGAQLLLEDKNGWRLYRAGPAPLE